MARGATAREVAAIRGEAAGVPFVALPPDGATGATAPLVLVWHLGSPPRSETAMAAALPLRGLLAWRVYLGLPMLGGRLPAGGLDEFFRRFRDDLVLNVFEPVTRQAVAELPPALAELRGRLPTAGDPVALVGGSMGAWVALSVLTEAELPVTAVALVSPALRLTSVVGRYERLWGMSYEWSDRSLAVADRLDFVARAEEIAAREVALLQVVGALDDDQGFREPARQLHHAVARRAPSDLVEIAGMGHTLADEPSLEPAPQTRHAARVDAAVAAWLRRTQAERAAEQEPGKNRA